MPPPQEDRHDPLPGLLSIPGFLVRRLGRRGRIIVGVVGALALACGVAAAVVEIPKINDTKRDNAAEARRDQAAALELQRRRLIAEQRPQRGASRVFPALTPKRSRATRSARSCPTRRTLPRSGASAARP